MKKKTPKQSKGGESYFKDLLTVNFDQARALVKRHGSPLLVLSRQRVRDSFAALQRALPNVQIFYAIKSNHNSEILKTLKQAGASFEVASFGELKMVMKIGINPKDVLNTQPFLSEKDFAECYKAGQRWFIFDNLDQLKRLTSKTNDIDLLLRLSFPNRNCQVDLSYKFGATIKEAEALIKAAHDTGARVHGVSFHVGSQSYTTKNYIKALKAVRKLFDKMQTQGIMLDSIDMGGGFPVPYTKALPPIERFAAPIRRKLVELFPGMKISAEPGRFICGLTQSLIVKVNGKNVRRGVPWYYLDDGVYNSFSGKVYDHCEYRILTEKTGTPIKSVLAGPTCDSFDIVAEDIALPHLDIGDIILVPAMGAYTNVSSTTYNGFDQAKIITID